MIESVLRRLFFENKGPLPCSPGLRDRNQILAAAPTILDRRGEGAALVQSPMTAWRGERRVEDRILGGGGHSSRDGFRKLIGKIEKGT